MSDLKNVQLTGPYESFRDYIISLEARGRVIRIKEMDQDKYEMTAFIYKLIDKYGYDSAPTVVVERLKINGEWIEGPVIGNPYGGLDTEAMGFGIENVTTDHMPMYKAALEKVKSVVGPGGQWREIEPAEVDASTAPCKEVIAIGDDVDIEQFAWLQSNPADGGRYISMGSTIIEDPVMGRNVGTYRCQVKSKNKIGINPEIGQNAWTQLMGARQRGEKSVQAAVVVGADPITWALSSSKAARPGQDELKVAGGLREQAVDVVKCETSDIMVPAHSEIVIEGEIPMDWEEEGPFGEMYGYMGLKKDQNFYMNIKAITHRKKPWIPNSFTGVTRGFLTTPMDATAFFTFRRLVYNLVAIHSPTSITGFVIASIDKKLAGDGIAAGMQIAAGLNIAKITIIVDKDVDIFNLQEVFSTVGARWQPHPASLIVPQSKGMRLDPSAVTRGMTSKIIIDATRQWPDEGGPEVYPVLNRDLLAQNCPESFDLTEAKWDDWVRDFESQ